MSAIDTAAATLRDRLLARRAEWADAHLSTAPADRERAERAIRGLYQLRGLARPSFEWVASPAAGVDAYGETARREAVTDPYVLKRKGLNIRGKYIRYFDGLADPFPLRPQRRRSMVTRLERAFAELDPPVRAAAIGPVGREIVASLSQRFGVERDFEPYFESYRVPAGGTGAGRFASRPRTASPVEAIEAMQPGQFDLDGAALDLLFSVFDPRLVRRATWDSADQALVRHRLEVARSAGPWWALHGLAIVSERPEALSIDADGRLHSTEGPAIRYADGLSIWAVAGILVPESVAVTPERITVDAIDAERNVEVRRVMIERFGYERLLRDGGAELVHEDGAGRLWRRVGPPPRRELREVLVEVLNATPESDGTFKTYFLRVPPTMSTAHEAVAWTFGMEAERYHPIHET